MELGTGAGALIGALIGGLVGGLLCGWLIGALCGALIACGEALELESVDVRVIASVPAPAPANSSVTTVLANDIPKNPVRMSPQSFDGVVLAGDSLTTTRYGVGISHAQSPA